MLISPAYAQDVAGMFGSATQFLPLVLIFVVFYFLLIRPQQQKQKDMRQMISALKRGDRVVTGGGIVGTVQRVPMVQDKDGKQVPSAEIEVEIVDPSGGSAIHTLHGGVPASINWRRDDRIRLRGIEAGWRIIDERLHVLLERRFLGIVPVGRLGQKALQRALQPQWRRPCRGNVQVRLRDIHQA